GPDPDPRCGEESFPRPIGPEARQEETTGHCRDGGNRLDWEQDEQSRSVQNETFKVQKKEGEFGLPGSGPIIMRNAKCGRERPEGSGCPRVTIPSPFFESCTLHFALLKIAHVR